MTANSDSQDRLTVARKHEDANSPAADSARDHYDRAIALLKQSEWDKAHGELSAAIEKGLDVAAVFVETYGDAGDFEDAFDIELPGDIADIVDPISEEEDAALARLTEETLNAEKLEQLRAAAGGWVGLNDAEEMKRMLYQARIDGSREPPAP